LALRGVNDREVVVRLGEVRIILRELGEDLDRFLGVALLGEDQALEETRLRIAALRREHFVHALESLFALAGLEQLRGIIEIVGARRRRADERRKAEENRPPTQAQARGPGNLHCVIFSRPYETFRILD